MSAIIHIIIPDGFFKRGDFLILVHQLSRKEELKNFGLFFLTMLITTTELKKLIDGKKKDYILIDVRQPDELLYGMIPTAKNISLPELEEAFLLTEREFVKKYGFAKPNKKGKIIMYCRTGGRSQTATRLLVNQGYNAINYAGSIWEWSDIDPTVKKYFH